MLSQHQAKQSLSVKNRLPLAVNVKGEGIKMAVVVGSGSAVSTAANTLTADLINGQFQFISKGKLTLIAKGSAAGMYINTLSVNGVPICSEQPLMYTGTAGTISVNDNVVCSQVVAGGKVEFRLRNSSGGALTTDYLILHDPVR